MVKDPVLAEKDDYGEMHVAHNQESYVDLFFLRVIPWYSTTHW